MKYIFTSDGGFLVQSDAGNWAYAYRTSAMEHLAHRKPSAAAQELARRADEDAVFNRTESGADQQRYLSKCYDEAVRFWRLQGECHGFDLDGNPL